MHETEDVASGKDLARFLDPTGDPFTMLLLQLAATADQTRLYPAAARVPGRGGQLGDLVRAGGHPVRRAAARPWSPWSGGLAATGSRAAETIAYMVADYKKGKIALPVRDAT